MSKKLVGLEEAEELREGFRGLRINAEYKQDEAAYCSAKAFHVAADRLVVKLGGESVFKATENPCRFCPAPAVVQVVCADPGGAETIPLPVCEDCRKKHEF